MRLDAQQYQTVDQSEFLSFTLLGSLIRMMAHCLNHNGLSQLGFLSLKKRYQEG